MCQNLPFWKGRIIFYCIYSFYFVHHSSVDGHLDCLHLLAIVNNCPMNMAVQTSFQDPAFNSFECIPRSWILNHMVILLYIFWGPSYAFPQRLCPFTFPPVVHKVSNFSTSLPLFFIFWIFAVSSPKKCELVVVSHCGFDLHILSD
jgi:hypothetical protein